MKRYRLALLLCIGAYPAVLLALALAPRNFGSLPLLVKPLFIIPIVVTWVVYVVSPFVMSRFGGWLGVRH